MADVDAYLGRSPPSFRRFTVDDWLTLAGDIDAPAHDHLRRHHDRAVVHRGRRGPARRSTRQFPFVRGRTARGARQGWDVRQLVDVRRGQRRRGRRARTRCHVGLAARRHADDPVDRAVARPACSTASCSTSPRSSSTPATAGSRRPEPCGRCGQRAAVDPASLAGSLGADPFGDWAVDRDDDRLDGRPRPRWSTRHGHSSPSTPTCASPRSTATRFHDAGASDAEELGIGLAVVVATLRTLTDGGLDVEAAFGPTRAAPRRDRRPVRDDRQVPRRPALLARVAEVAGRPDGRLPGAAARRHVTGDDDPLRRRREHRAVDGRLLRRRGRRRRRHHRAPARHVRRRRRPASVPDGSPATPRRCSRWSRTWPG